jgi:hypothetical protein
MNNEHKYLHEPHAYFAIFPGLGGREIRFCSGES